jgi:hypothetical protein
MKLLVQAYTEAVTFSATRPRTAGRCAAATVTAQAANLTMHEMIRIARSARSALSVLCHQQRSAEAFQRLCTRANKIF